MAKLKKKRLFIILGVVLIIVIFVVLNANRGSSKIKVQTAKVTKGSITAKVSGSAKIQPEIQVKISSKVSGQIMRLGVKEGDFVHKGDFLVQLDPEYYAAARDQAQSNFDYSQAGYRKAQNDYDRAQKLFADNLMSKAELDVAKSTYEQALASVAQAKAAFNQAKDDLAKTTIYSPMDGTVSQLNKKEGEMAMGSQFTLDVIMVVADLTKMLAETEIDENDVVSVSVGDTAEIAVDAYTDSIFTGIVKEIANTGTTLGEGTQEEVTNFMVKVSMLEMPESLRPSMSATVDILTEVKHAALKIPIQCVTMRPPKKEEKPESEKQEAKDKSDKDDAENEKAGESEKTEETGETKTDSTDAEDKEPVKDVKPIKVVFVVEEGVARQVEVEMGITSDTDWEVKAGLEEGQDVVSGSYRILSKQLKDGDEVEIDNSLSKTVRNEG